MRTEYTLSRSHARGTLLLQTVPRHVRHRIPSTCLPLQAARDLSEARAVSQLKHCRLLIEHEQIEPQYAQDPWVPAPLHGFLRHTGSHLEALTLHFINYARQEPEQFADYHVRGHFLNFFGEMAEGLRLCRIRALELGSIPYRVSDFRKFLSVHHTLRHIRLVNCLSDCGSQALRTILAPDLERIRVDIEDSH